MNAEMRKSALRRYIVFRVKAMEFLDMAVIWKALDADQISVPNPVQRTSSDFAAGLRTVLLSWFALLIDKNGMDVIKLWMDLFPKHRTEIEEVWSHIKPTWEIIRSFRDRVGFHADKPLRFFEARNAVTVQTSAIEAAIQEIRSLLIN